MKTTTCRSCWRNCAIEPDPKIREIDRLEDRLNPFTPGVIRTRELISSLELCHHKAERWIENIIEAIGAGDTEKGMGFRPRDEKHAVETIWKHASSALAGSASGRQNQRLAAPN